MLDITDLPREHSFPVGNYRLRYSTITLKLHDAEFVDGATVTPISGRTLHRLRNAYGAECVIEPWDQETLDLVLAHLESVGKTARVAQLRAGELQVDEPITAVDPIPAPAVSPSADTDPPVAVGSEPEIVGAQLDELEDIKDINALRSLAAGYEIQFDNRWGRQRLIEAIRTVRAQQRR